MGTSPRRLAATIALVALLAAAVVAVPPLRRRLVHPVLVRLRGPATVQQRLEQFGPARARLQQRFDLAGVAFPPARVVLLGVKDERRLDVYAGTSDDTLRLVASYPVLAASGVLGPKLREGDRQVPEGVYSVESLNPDSRFHVALRVGYPNDFDRAMARRDGRHHLGGDIMIHGGSASIGCLAMGDDTAEELFVLAAVSGIQNVTVVLAPVDLRRRELPNGLSEGWRAALYSRLAAQMARLPNERRGPD